MAYVRLDTILCFGCGRVAHAIVRDMRRAQWPEQSFWRVDNEVRLRNNPQVQRMNFIKLGCAQYKSHSTICLETAAKQAQSSQFNEILLSWSEAAAKANAHDLQQLEKGSLRSELDGLNVFSRRAADLGQGDRVRQQPFPSCMAEPG